MMNYCGIMNQTHKTGLKNNCITKPSKNAPSVCQCAIDSVKISDKRESIIIVVVVLLWIINAMGTLWDSSHCIEVNSQSQNTIITQQHKLTLYSRPGQRWVKYKRSFEDWNNLIKLSLMHIACIGILHTLGGMATTQTHRNKPRHNP